MTADNNTTTALGSAISRLTEASKNLSGQETQKFTAEAMNSVKKNNQLNNDSINNAKEAIEKLKEQISDFDFSKLTSSVEEISKAINDTQADTEKGHKNFMTVIENVNKLHEKLFEVINQSQNITQDSQDYLKNIIDFISSSTDAIYEACNKADNNLTNSITELALNVTDDLSQAKESINNSVNSLSETIDSRIQTILNDLVYGDNEVAAANTKIISNLQGYADSLSSTINQLRKSGAISSQVAKNLFDQIQDVSNGLKSPDLGASKVIEAVKILGTVNKGIAIESVDGLSDINSQEFITRIEENNKHIKSLQEQIVNVFSSESDNGIVKKINGIYEDIQKYQDEQVVELQSNIIFSSEKLRIELQSIVNGNNNKFNQELDRKLDDTQKNDITQSSKSLSRSSTDAFKKLLLSSYSHEPTKLGFDNKKQFGNDAAMKNIAKRMMYSSNVLSSKAGQEMTENIVSTDSDGKSSINAKSLSNFIQLMSSHSKNTKDASDHIRQKYTSLNPLKFGKLDEGNLGKDSQDLVRNFASNAEDSAKIVRGVLARITQSGANVNKDQIKQLQDILSELEHTNQSLTDVTSKSKNWLKAMLDFGSTLRGWGKKITDYFGLSKFIPNLDNLISGAIKQYEDDGNLRYKMGMTDAYLGNNLDVKRADRMVNEVADHFQHLSYGKIKFEEPATAYMNLARQGGHYGGSSMEAGQDAQKFTEKTFAMQKVNDFSQSTVNSVWKTMYKDLGKSADETAAVLAQLGDTAKRTGQPLDQYASKVMSLANSLRKYGIHGDQTQAIMDELVSMSLREEDAESIADGLGNAIDKMSKDFNQSAFEGMMLGQADNPFEAINQGLIAFDEKGNPTEEYSNMMAERVFNKVNRDVTVGGGWDSTVGEMFGIRALMEAGFKQKDAVILAENAKEGDFSKFQALFKKKQEDQGSAQERLQNAQKKAEESISKAASQLAETTKWQSEIALAQKHLAESIRENLTEPLKWFREVFESVLTNVTEGLSWFIKKIGAFIKDDDSNKEELKKPENISMSSFEDWMSKTQGNGSSPIGEGGSDSGGGTGGTNDGSGNGGNNGKTETDPKKETEDKAFYSEKDANGKEVNVYDEQAYMRQRNPMLNSYTYTPQYGNMYTPVLNVKELSDSTKKTVGKINRDNNATTAAIQSSADRAINAHKVDTEHIAKSNDERGTAMRQSLEEHHLYEHTLQEDQHHYLDGLFEKLRSLGYSVTEAAKISAGALAQNVKGVATDEQVNIISDFEKKHGGFDKSQGILGQGTFRSWGKKPGDTDINSVPTSVLGANSEDLTTGKYRDRNGNYTSEYYESDTFRSGTFLTANAISTSQEAGYLNSAIVNLAAMVQTAKTNGADRKDVIKSLVRQDSLIDFLFQDENGDSLGTKAKERIANMLFDLVGTNNGEESEFSKVLSAMMGDKYKSGWEFLPDANYQHIQQLFEALQKDGITTEKYKDSYGKIAQDAKYNDRFMNVQRGRMGVMVQYGLNDSVEDEALIDQQNKKDDTLTPHLGTRNGVSLTENNRMKIKANKNDNSVDVTALKDGTKLRSLHNAIITNKDDENNTVTYNLLDKDGNQTKASVTMKTDKASYETSSGLEVGSKIEAGKDILSLSKDDKANITITDTTGKQVSGDEALKFIDTGMDFNDHGGLKEGTGDSEDATTDVSSGGEENYNINVEEDGQVEDASKSLVGRAANQIGAILGRKDASAWAKGQQIFGGTTLMGASSGHILNENAIRAQLTSAYGIQDKDNYGYDQNGYFGYNEKTGKYEQNQAGSVKNLVAKANEKLGDPLKENDWSNAKIVNKDLIEKAKISKTEAKDLLDKAGKPEDRLKDVENAATEAQQSQEKMMNKTNDAIQSAQTDEKEEDDLQNINVNINVSKHVIDLLKNAINIIKPGTFAQVPSVSGNMASTSTK